MNIKLYPAKVTNNIHPEKNGQVQIYIDHLMEGVIPTVCPWADPFYLGGGGTGISGSLNIPELNSMVWVFFQDEVYYKQCFYLADVSLENINAGNLFDTSVFVDGWLSQYPDVKYTVLKNGVCMAMSSGLQEITIYNPSNGGSYIFINSLGEIHIKSGANPLQKMVLGEDFKTEVQKNTDAISELQSAISSWTVVPEDGGAAFKTATTAFTNLPVANLTNVLSLKNKSN